MIVPLSCCITANEVRQRYVPAGRSQFVAVPSEVSRPHIRNRSDALKEKKQTSADISRRGATEDCSIELAALSRPLRTVHPVRLECAMPVALVVLLLDITLIYHASRTGRLQPWAFIILMIPLVGALAYIVVELVPEWFGSPGA